MSKLVFLLFALFIAGGSAMVEINQCLDMINVEELQKMSQLEDLDELGTLCPVILPFFDCLENAVRKATGMSISDLPLFINDDAVVRGVNLFINMRDTMRDVCTEDTPLHKAYMQHQECYRTLTGNDKKCKEDAEAAYEAYREFSRTIHEEQGTTPSAQEKDCMVISYMVACYSADIKETCGDSAYNTFMEILRRTTILKNGACSPGEAVNLKTKFLDFIEEESSRKDIFSQVFDFRRRR